MENSHDNTEVHDPASSLIHDEDDARPSADVEMLLRGTFTGVDASQLVGGQTISGLLHQDGQFFPVETSQESGVYFQTESEGRVSYAEVADVDDKQEEDLNEAVKSHQALDDEANNEQEINPVLVDDPTPSTSQGATGAVTEIAVATAMGDSIKKMEGVSLLKMDANGALVPMNETDARNQAALLNSGEESFQTVTLMSPEVQSYDNNVSYVLIVSNPDGEPAAMSAENMLALQTKDTQDKNDSPADLRTLVINGAGDGMNCTYCDYSSPKRYLLSRHMKTHSEERPHKCTICGHAFKTLASLTNHVNTHSGIRPHKCKDCDSAFTTSGELVRHQRYKHTFEKPHKCTQCDYSSVELSKMKRHMRSHTGERPYQCTQCNYASPDTYKLKRHMRIHTGEKPYECDVCAAKFTQSNSLKAHKLIHTGNKPVYQCELCPATCGRKTDLKTHVQKLHSSDKTFECKKCHKLFPDRYNYKLHVKAHDGERSFKCGLCLFATLADRRFEEHLVTQHENHTPYQCVDSDCKEAFRYRALLRQHKIFIHGSEDFDPQDKTVLCTCGKKFVLESNMMKHKEYHDDQGTPTFPHAEILNDIELADEICEDITVELAEQVQSAKMAAIESVSAISLTNAIPSTSSASMQQSEVMMVNEGDDNRPIETVDQVRQMIQNMENDHLVMRRIVKEVDGHRVVVMEVGPADDCLNNQKDLTDDERYVPDTTISHDSAVQLLYDIVEAQNQQQQQLQEQTNLTQLSQSGNVVTLHMDDMTDTVMAVDEGQHVDDLEGDTNHSLEQISLIQTPQQVQALLLKRNGLTLVENPDYMKDSDGPSDSKKLKTEELAEDM